MQTDKIPELDERVWQAWIKKNEAQDKIRFARRVKVVGLVTAFLLLGALLAKLAWGDLSAFLRPIQETQWNFLSITGAQEANRRWTTLPTSRRYGRNFSAPTRWGSMARLWQARTSQVANRTPTRSSLAFWHVSTRGQQRLGERGIDAIDSAPHGGGRCYAL